jgi:hypothetical protein
LGSNQLDASVLSIVGASSIPAAIGTTDAGVDTGAASGAVMSRSSYDMTGAHGDSLTGKSESVVPIWVKVLASGGMEDWIEY